LEPFKIYIKCTLKFKLVNSNAYLLLINKQILASLCNFKSNTVCKWYEFYSNKWKLCIFHEHFSVSFFLLCKNISLILSFFSTPANRELHRYKRNQGFDHHRFSELWTVLYTTILCIVADRFFFIIFVTRPIFSSQPWIFVVYVCILKFFFSLFLKYMICDPIWPQSQS